MATTKRRVQGSKTLCNRKGCTNRGTPRDGVFVCTPHVRAHGRMVDALDARDERRGWSRESC